MGDGTDAARRALVTGASRGIGLAVVTALLDDDADVRVVAVARRATPQLTALAEAGRVRILEADLSESDGSDRIAEAAGAVDILVNNVGATTPHPDGFLSTTDADWTTALNLNLLAATRVTRSVLPGMLERGNGHIVTISSVNARLPDPLVVEYSAAKAALSNFSLALSKEFAPRGIRVNAISPGPVATDLWLGADGVAQTVSRASGASPDDVAHGAAAQSSTGRFTTPAEVAALVVFLVSEASANITGADIRIDGGLIGTL